MVYMECTEALLHAPAFPRILLVVTSRITILGIPVDALTREQAVQRIVGWLGMDGQHHIATPNPEMLVAATRNAALADALKATDLNIPDGVGLLWAAKRAGTPLPQRVTGVDVMTDVCAMSQGPVFLLGAWGTTAERAGYALQKRNPHLQIAGTYAGSPSAAEEQHIVERINASGAKAVFVAYGVPSQELWIRRNLARMPGVRIAMGVGGAFDFLAGNRKRAPRALQRLGVEWLWRLLQEPSRLRRILTATVVFPRMVLASGR